MEYDESDGSDGAVHIRPMTRAEMHMAIAWAAAEGWNPGRHDADAFFATDPEGFLIAEKDGAPVGCVSSVIYDDTFSFGGFFIVLPEHRHKGYGTVLRQAAIGHVGNRIMGLDGVVAQQDNYRKTGFVFAYNNIRYEATGCAANAPRLTHLVEIPIEEIADYDTRFFPVPRRAFLENWTRMPDSAGFAVRENGCLAGYGVIRPCTIGFKIGPLFADNRDIATTLYRALAAHAPGAPVYLDVPQVNAQAVALAESYGMKEVFQTARMYLNGAPQVDLDGIFGVTSFELG